MSFVRGGRLYLSLEEVERICPPCAEQMRQAGITALREDRVGSPMGDRRVVLSRLEELVRPPGQRGKV